MTKETITTRQAVCIIFMFLTGTVIMVNLYPETEQDTWISILIAAVAAVPLILVYARIMRLYPEKDIFRIIEAISGKALSKTLIALLSWYAISLFALSMRSFADFVEIVAMPETPQLPVLLIMTLLAAYIAKSGAETFGKLSIVLFVIVTVAIAVNTLLSVNNMDFSNIQPVLAHDAGALSAGAFSFLTFPLAETVLFLGMADTVKKTDSPRRIYIWGIGLGVSVILITMLRNIEVLGVPIMKAEYFPSYITVRVIDIGNVITRIEGSISMNYILSGFAKTALCLLFAAKGAAALFGVQDYKRLVMPVGLFGLALSATVYKNAMELVVFFKAYSYYVVPFGIVIPLIIWAAAEIKTRKTGRMLSQG